MKNIKVLLAMQTFCFLGQAQPRLLIKMPTRERAQRFFSCLNQYYSLLSKKYPCHFLISCDVDDESMNCAAVRKRLSGYPNLTVVFGQSISKIDAYNRDLNNMDDYDMILVTSDDAVPVVFGYDQVIIETMVAKFPDFDGVLKFDDGISHGSILNALPVVGKRFYKRFGYLYQPSYKSFFCDLELTLVSKLLKKEMVINAVLIRHDNPMCGASPFDDLYKRNYRFDQADHKIFVERAAHKFFLSDISDKDYAWVRDSLKTWHLDK